MSSGAMNGDCRGLTMSMLETIFPKSSIAVRSLAGSHLKLTHGVSSRTSSPRSSLNYRKTKKKTKNKKKKQLNCIYDYRQQ